jgi:hypothetical protein
VRKIETHAELTEVIREGDGYIVNDRSDRPMLHQARCESLEVMSTRKYNKLFFDELDEAMKWANRRYGANGWETCGRCRA